MELNLNEAISKGAFSSTQQGMIKTLKTTFLVVSTNFYIQNVKIKREYVDYNLIITFTQLIGLQKLWLDVRNIDFNLTGTAFVSYDPLNIYFDSLYIDTYGLKNFASILAPWNYPEASLNGMIYANNITVIASSQRTFSEDPSIISYMGPANITASNFDLKDYSLRSPNVGAGLIAVSSNNWVPNDGLTQVIQVNNFKFSVTDNPLGIKSNSMIILQDQNIYRPIVINATSLSFVSLEIPSQIFMYVIGNIRSQLYVNNVIFKDSSTIQYVMGSAAHQKVVLSNITFSNFTNVKNSVFVTYKCFAVMINSMNFVDFNMDKTNENEIIRMQNFNFTNTLISNLNFVNVNLYKTPVIKSVSLINQISIVNSYFNGGYQESSNILFSVGIIGSIIFQNHTFSSLSWEILSIDKIDMRMSLNSVISNIVITNSSSSLLNFGNFINPSSTIPNILIENISFSDSEIKSSIELINTGNIFTNSAVNIILNNLKFNGIKFSNKGNLLKLNHKMPQPITISNSKFTNLTSALIVADSAGYDSIDSIMHANFFNWSFDQINNQYSSLINTNNKAVLKITNSNFSNIYSYEEGAILFAGFEKNSVDIYDWVFQNNSAVQGTIFVIESESFVKWTNWIFINNFSITGTIFQTSLNGFFYFYNSSISQNYAINNPVGELLDSVAFSIMSNVSIYNNEAISTNDVTSEFNLKWNKLWFVPKILAQYIIINKKLVINNIKASLIQLIVSSLRIQDNSVLKNQNIMFNVFLSELTISNSEIFNITGSIQVSSSKFSLINSNISKVVNLDQTSFIFVDYNSIFTLNSSTIVNSYSDFVNGRNSMININNFTMTNVTTSSYLFQISNCDGIEIDNIAIINWTSSLSNFISIQKSSNIKLSRFSGSQSEMLFTKIIDSNVTSIDTFVMDKLLQPLNIKSSTVNLISNSSFTNNGNSDSIKGGAIYIRDSKVNIENSTFSNNSAITGGAICFECSSTLLWSLQIEHSTFRSNIGISQGGAIFYNYYRPSLNNVLFINNKANYGPNFASYAFKIRFENSNSNEMIINNIVSGVEYNALRFVLLDFDNQTMVLNYYDQLSISPLNKSESKIKGINSALLRSGAASFNNFVAIAKPGSTNIQFQITSKAIDYEKIKTAYDILPNNTIYSNFRYCKQGEAQLEDNTWSTWSPGTYSLNWNSTEWYQCVSNSVWIGGNQLYLYSGYWRKTLNTSKIVRWVNPDAWSGGFIDQDFGPTVCSKGYTGILWNEWQIEDGVKYEKVSDNVWSQWPSPIVNSIRIICLSLLVFTFISWIIIINIRKTEESQLSVLLRIFANYLQIISSLLSFDMKYPTTISDIFIPFNQIGSSEVFLSFDCFISDYNITGPFPSNKIFKVFLTAILPIVLLIIFSSIWVMLRVIRREFVPDLRRNIVISFISIVFLLHPRLVQNSIVMFQCVMIDNGDTRANADLEVQWFSPSHIKWIFAIAFPILVIWVFAMPILALVLLFKSFKKHKNNKMMQYLLILYQGLRHEIFYWEFINTFRKSIILLIFIALSFLNQNIKIVLSTIVLYP